VRLAERILDALAKLAAIDLAIWDHSEAHKCHLSAMLKPPGS
jgi:hypothetical protein